MRKIKMKNRSKIGSAFENALKNYFEKDGLFVVRSAASKSPVDLVVFQDSEDLVIQCKSTKSDKPLPKFIGVGKTYKELEDLNVGAYKVLAFYSYKTNVCEMFVYIKHKKTWKNSATITNLIPK